MPVATRFQGKAWSFGDDVDTDQITPGKYLAMITPAELGPHCLEGADPEFAKHVQPGDFIVAGENFGCGSSREHAPLAIKGAKVPVVLAESFARIFYRNAYNVGLPVVEVPGITQAVKTGDPLDVDLSTGMVTNTRTGQTFKAEPLTEKALELLEAGGLIELTRRRLKDRASK